VQNLTKTFTDWVRKQPADKEYDYYDVKECALAQFGRSLGYPNAFGVDTHFHKNTTANVVECVHVLPRMHSNIIGTVPHTFGALAERLADVGL